MTYEEILNALKQDIKEYVDKQIKSKRKKYIPNWSDEEISGFMPDEVEGIDIIFYESTDNPNTYFLYIYLHHLPVKVSIRKYLMEIFGINKKGIVIQEEIERKRIFFKYNYLYSSNTYYKLKDKELDIIYKKLQKN